MKPALRLALVTVCSSATLFYLSESIVKSNMEKLPRSRRQQRLKSEKQKAATGDGLRTVRVWWPKQILEPLPLRHEDDKASPEAGHVGPQDQSQVQQAVRDTCPALEVDVRDAKADEESRGGIAAASKRGSTPAIPAQRSGSNNSGGGGRCRSAQPHWPDAPPGGWDKV
jgi:hypothetical protein